MGKRGWNWLVNSRKWHYFMEDGRSLCGSWFIWSANNDAEDSHDDLVENCKACAKKVKKLRKEWESAGVGDSGSGGAGPVDQGGELPSGPSEGGTLRDVEQPDLLLRQGPEADTESHP